MPIYNGGKYLYYSLRSIQNQDMKEIEIIIVDDCSTDDSLSIIQSFMKEDNRIRLIKNQINRKILYSKSIAALNSNGKFIVELDQDDIFIRRDIFDMMFYEAENNSLDLVQVRDFEKDDFLFNKITYVNEPSKHLIFPQKMHYKMQPELTQRNFADKNNYLLWGLLIKSNIYKKAIYKLWPVIMNYKIIFHEDYTITFMIIILTKRYKYLNNFALIHLTHSKAASKNHLDNDNYYLGILFFANNLYNYYIKNKETEVHLLLNYVNLFLKEFKEGKIRFPDLFRYILKFILNSRFIRGLDKQILKKRLGINRPDFKTNNIYEYFIKKKEFNKVCFFQNNLTTNKMFGKKILVEDPLISIIIFCNDYLHLKPTLNSIENQSFNKFEIIVVFEEEKEKIKNLTDIISLQSKSSNTKIIKCKKCKGILCSIYNGASEVRGDYTLIIQPGVTLYLNDSLNNLYKQILEKGSPDILEFGHFINNDDFVNGNSLNAYKMKPNINIKLYLSKIKFNEDISIDENQEILFNKLINTKKLKSIMKDIFEFNTQKICELYNYYDSIIIFALNKINATYAHTKLYGTIQYINRIKQLKNYKVMNHENQKMKDSIFYINYLFENTGNNEREKIYALHKFYCVLSDIFNRFNNVSIEAYKLQKKFLNSENIPHIEKKNLVFYVNSLLN